MGTGGANAAGLQSGEGCECNSTSKEGAGHHARDQDSRSSGSCHGSLHRLLHVRQRCLPENKPCTGSSCRLPCCQDHWVGAGWWRTLLACCKLVGEAVGRGGAL